MSIKTYKLKILIPEGVRFTRDYGRKAQGMFLQCIRSVDLEMSQKLHSSTSKRPYSISRLFRSKKIPEMIHFTVTIIDPLVQTTFQRFLLQSTSPSVTIDHQSYQVIETMIESETFSSFTKPSIGTAIKINIKTPIILSSNSRKTKVDPLPFPERIWGNLWGTWSDLISPLNQEKKHEFLKAVRYQLATPAFNLKTVKCSVGKGGKIPGLLGYIFYEVENPENLEALIPLAEFASIWGIGSKRSRGYGKVTVSIKENKPNWNYTDADTKRNAENETNTDIDSSTNSNTNSENDTISKIPTKTNSETPMGTKNNEVRSDHIRDIE